MIVELLNSKTLSVLTPAEVKDTRVHLSRSQTGNRVLDLISTTGSKTLFQEALHV